MKAPEAPKGPDPARSEAAYAKARDLSLEWTALRHEVLVNLQYNRITFADAAKWIEASSRTRDPWIRAQGDYLARSWRSRGLATWDGVDLDPQAEIPTGGDAKRFFGGQ